MQDHFNLQRSLCWLPLLLASTVLGWRQAAFRRIRDDPTHVADPALEVRTAKPDALAVLGQLWPTAPPRGRYVVDSDASRARVEGAALGAHVQDQERRLSGEVETDAQGWRGRFELAQGPDDPRPLRWEVAGATWRRVGDVWASGERAAVAYFQRDRSARLFLQAVLPRETSGTHFGLALDLELIPVTAPSHEGPRR